MLAILTISISISQYHSDPPYIFLKTQSVLHDQMTTTVQKLNLILASDKNHNFPLVLFFVNEFTMREYSSTLTSHNRVE